MARSGSVICAITDPMLAQQPRLIDADELHGTATAACERPGFEPVELIDRLELRAGVAAIAFEMAAANIVVTVPTIQHPENLSGALAPLRRP